MKTLLLAGVALAATALAGAAQAADLPSRRAPQADYYSAPAPMFTWTGFYLGANLGAGWGSFTHGADQLFGKPFGFTGGPTVGFNWQAAPNLVVGLEGDWDLSNIGNTNQSAFFGFYGQGKVTSLATLRGRVGYAADRALIYATGGLAAGSTSYTVNDWRAVPFFGSVSGFQVGFALGAGLEYAFTDHVSGKAEYMFTSLASKEAFPYSPDWTNVGVNTSQIRTGLNYRF